MSGPLNYTTQVAAEKSAVECLGILGRSGASAVSLTYADRKPTGLQFAIDTPAGPKTFAVPVNITGVQKCLGDAYSRGGIAPRFTGPIQAERVAWRILKDWLEAQVALIDAQMASLDQVMLPYLRVDPDHTLYEAYLERETVAALEAGRGDP